MTKKKYLTGKELLERWNISNIDLVQLAIKWGLPTVVDDGNTYCELESDDWHVIEGFYFKIEDVEALEKDHPEYLPKDAPYIPKQGEAQPYLNKNNKYFSKELFIVIETWMAIYGPKGSLNLNKKHREQIILYLEQHHRELFPPEYKLKDYIRREKKLPAKIDRIVTMINKNNEGGPIERY